MSQASVLSPEASTIGSPESSALEPASASAPVTSSGAPPLPVPGSPDVVKRARAVLAAQRKIAAIGAVEVSRKDSFDIELGPAGPAGLRDAKDAMVQLVEAVLDELGAGAMARTDEEIQAAVGGAFEAAGVSVSDGSGELGRIASLDVRRVPGHSAMLGVTLTLSAPVGSDDLTCLLRADGAGFSRVMELRNDGYRSVRGSRFASVYAVTPPAPDGSWFVIDAHSHAWIASLWRGIEVRVFDPTSGSDRPRKVFEHADSAWLGDLVVATIEPRAAGFTVRYVSWDHLGGMVTRAYVRSLDRRGDDFERVGPFVAHPRDLLDELSSMDPRDAAKLGVPGSERAVREARRSLGGEASSFGELVVGGDSGWRPEDELGDEIDVSFRCPECQGFPRAVDYRAKKTLGSGWLIESISIGGATPRTGR